MPSSNLLKKCGQFDCVFRNILEEHIYLTCPLSHLLLLLAGFCWSSQTFSSLPWISGTMPCHLGFLKTSFDSLLLLKSCCAMSGTTGIYLMKYFCTDALLHTHLSFKKFSAFQWAPFRVKWVNIKILSQNDLCFIFSAQHFYDCPIINKQ